ncbi:hypothetical protein G7046_g2460 [Stylonectria norvegica]|nr:hypothetical protein G7046_g2460 [Stylonectria norvegica]
MMQHSSTAQQPQVQQLSAASVSISGIGSSSSSSSSSSSTHSSSHATRRRLRRRRPFCCLSVAVEAFFEARLVIPWQPRQPNPHTSPLKSQPVRFQARPTIRRDRYRTKILGPTYLIMDSSTSYFLLHSLASTLATRSLGGGVLSSCLILRMLSSCLPLSLSDAEAVLDVSPCGGRGHLDVTVPPTPPHLKTAFHGACGAVLRKLSAHGVLFLMQSPCLAFKNGLQEWPPRMAWSPWPRFVTLAPSQSLPREAVHAATTETRLPHGKTQPQPASARRPSPCSPCSSFLSLVSPTLQINPRLREALANLALEEKRSMARGRPRTRRPTTTSPSKGPSGHSPSLRRRAPYPSATWNMASHLPRPRMTRPPTPDLEFHLSPTNRSPQSRRCLQDQIVFPHWRQYDLTLPPPLPTGRLHLLADT